jgi:hypothetical protein
VKHIIALVIVSWGLVTGQPRPETGKLFPTDDSRTDSGLATLKQRLLTAANRKDVTALASMLSATLRVDFADTSSDAFLRDFASRSPEEQAEFWRDLRDAVALGLSKTDTLVYAPATYLALSKSRYDLVITGDHVNVHEAPNEKSAVVATLSHDFVNKGPKDETELDSRIRIDGYEYPWRQIVLPSGTVAWAPEKYVQGRDSMRLAFRQVSGVWRLVMLARGD